MQAVVDSEPKPKPAVKKKKAVAKKAVGLPAAGPHLLATDQDLSRVPGLLAMILDGPYAAVR